VVYAALGDSMSIDDHAGGPGRGAVSLLWRNLDGPVAQVTRPVTQLAGFARVPLSPGEQVRVTFRLHADRTGNGDASQVTERRYWWASIRVLRGCVRRRAGRGSGSVRHRATPSATRGKPPPLVGRQSVAVPWQRGWHPSADCLLSWSGVPGG
jgi:hypothetical protein